MPYETYDTIKFSAPISSNGDCFDRYIIRIEEMRQSLNIIQQAILNIPIGLIKAENYKIVIPKRQQLKHSMVSLINHFKLYSEGFSVTKGELYTGVEAPKGEFLRHRQLIMYINTDILWFYSYFIYNISFFKVNALEPEFASRLFNAKRDGLVTEGTFNEVWFEGCNKMKKVSSCHKGMSKLSASQNKLLGLTQVNSYFYTGSTLPCHDNDMLRKCIFSFSDPEFR
jgi:hypothetical protein